MVPCRNGNGFCWDDGWIFPGGTPSQFDLGSMMGYDIRYGLTRLRRLPGLAMSENDKLQIYIKLNKQSDDQNPLRKIGASDTNEQRLKSLLLAVHNFESIFRHLPAPPIAGT